MMTDRERAPLILRRTERGLEPRSRLAHETLAKFAVHSDVRVSIKKQRSNQQNEFYWVGLQKLIDATDCFPTTDHLHDAIKIDLGYVTPVKSLTGEISFIPDSTAFGKMDAAQFNDFFERARKRIIEVCHVDPWAEADTND